MSVQEYGDVMIPLAEPVIGVQEKIYVLDALESGWINTTGPYVERLQDMVEDYLLGGHAVATGSGTAALFLALKAAGVGPGDKVIVPTITFVATINAIRHVGADPVFVDCNRYLNMTFDGIKDYIRTHDAVKAILPVHIFGNPVDMVQVWEIANEYGLAVIEDACEALGSNNNIKRCGATGDFGVLSFSFNKMITTGNGGMVICKKPQLADKIDYWAKQSKDDHVNYIHNEVGYNLGMSNLLAALGVAQMEKLPDILLAKQHIADEYESYLGEGKMYCDRRVGHRSNAWFIGYHANNKEAVMDELDIHGFQTRPLWTPNHLQQPFANCDRIGTLEAAEYYAQHVINLPCSANLYDEHIAQICGIIKDVDGD